MDFGNKDPLIKSQLSYGFNPKNQTNVAPVPSQPLRSGRSEQVYNQLKDMFDNFEMSEVISDLEKLHHNHLKNICEKCHSELSQNQDLLMKFEQMLGVNG